MNKCKTLFVNLGFSLVLLCSITSLLTGCHTVRFNPENFNFTPDDSPMLQQGKINFLAQNYQLAFKQLMVPAKHGNPQAQYAIGYMYFYGKGVKQNKPLGIHWIRNAAKQGNKQAIASLKLLEQNNTAN